MSINRLTEHGALFRNHRRAYPAGSMVLGTTLLRFRRTVPEDRHPTTEHPSPFVDSASLDRFIVLQGVRRR